MDTIEIIKKYYKKDSDLFNLLVKHSTDVTNKALAIADNHPELNIDKVFVAEAGMLHDIGIFLTNAPAIHCHGIAPYICHGYLGREILDIIGLHRHALVCERHTGVGLSAEDIQRQKLPIPVRDMVPITIEEKLICFADCFYSKTKLKSEKSVESIKRGLAKFGEPSVNQFEEWCKIFL